MLGNDERKLNKESPQNDEQSMQILNISVDPNEQEENNGIGYIISFGE